MTCENHIKTLFPTVTFLGVEIFPAQCTVAQSDIPNGVFINGHFYQLTAAQAEDVRHSGDFVGIMFVIDDLVGQETGGCLSVVRHFDALQGRHRYFMVVNKQRDRVQLNEMFEAELAWYQKVRANTQPDWITLHVVDEEQKLSVRSF